MRSATPGDERDLRPPVAITAAPSPGDVGRRSVWRRSTVVPRLLEDAGVGFPPHHPFVRRFWTAVVGPGAVADLLRLIAAARAERHLPRPDTLPTLAVARLVLLDGRTVWVRPSVPPLGGAELRRMAPGLKAEHQAQVGRYLAGEPENS